MHQTLRWTESQSSSRCSSCLLTSFREVLPQRFPNATLMHPCLLAMKLRVYLYYQSLIGCPKSLREKVWYHCFFSYIKILIWGSNLKVVLLSKILKVFIFYFSVICIVFLHKSQNGWSQFSRIFKFISSFLVRVDNIPKHSTHFQKHNIFCRETVWQKLQQQLKYFMSKEKFWDWSMNKHWD